MNIMEACDIFIGTDIVEVSRIDSSISTSGKRFLNRIYTEIEQRYCDSKPNPSIHYAGRFAAKEAFSKALGTGIGRVVSFQDLTIRSNEHGKPYFMPSEKLRLYLQEKGIKHGHLSISDESQNALAFVVLEALDDSGKEN